MSNNFYIYAYIRSKDSATAMAGTPYYIGKGCKNRMFKKHISAKTPDDRSLIVILENNLTEVGALALERRYIKWYGRKDLGTGVLNNLTDGGEGTSGWKASEETKKKMSNSQTGKVYDAETCEKISKIHTGKPSKLKGRIKKEVKHIKKHKELSPEQLIQLQKMTEKVKKKVCVFGIIYESITYAAKCLNINQETLRRKCHSEKYTDYIIMESKNE